MPSILYPRLDINWSLMSARDTIASRTPRIKRTISIAVFIFPPFYLKLVFNSTYFNDTILIYHKKIKKSNYVKYICFFMIISME